MGEICLAFGAPHSPILFVTPEKWLARVHRGESLAAAPESFRLTEKNVARTKRQIARCRAAYDELRRLLEAARPDVLVVVGDDQGENFDNRIMPQFAVYAGAEAEGSFGLGPRLPEDQQEDTRTVSVACDRGLAEAILDRCLEAGVDIAFSRQLPGAGGLGHAHMWPLRHLDPELAIPIVPIFVNAYFPPFSTPRRCFELGRVIADAIGRSDRRVAVFASGGLSHFPRHLGAWGVAPYPMEKRWHIAEAFDRRVLDCIVSERRAELAEIDSEALHEAGNDEFRNWIVLGGALDGRTGRIMAYEPVYTVAIGLGFAVWT